jgi:hypothetical protein
MMISSINCDFRQILWVSNWGIWKSTYFDDIALILFTNPQQIHYRNQKSFFKWSTNIAWMPISSLFKKIEFVKWIGSHGFLFIVRFNPLGIVKVTNSSYHWATTPHMGQTYMFFFIGSHQHFINQNTKIGHWLYFPNVFNPICAIYIAYFFIMILLLGLLVITITLKIEWTVNIIKQIGSNSMGICEPFFT